MNTKPCKKCGRAISYAVTPKGRTVALDPTPAIRYVFAGDPSRRDPVEPRVEPWRCYTAHQETCSGIERPVLHSARGGT